MALARGVTQDLAGGRDGAIVTHFDATMKARLSATQLAAGWRSASGPLGPYEGPGQVSTQSVGANLVVGVLARFARGELDVTTTFLPTGEIAGLFLHPVNSSASATTASSAAWRPPSYDHPGRFSTRVVTVGSGPLAVHGILTLPHGPGPFPAVVLVPGSGPVNANEAVGAEEPFRDLAEGLSSQGVVVLRYDKVTLDHPSAFANSSVTSGQTDVVPAVVAINQLRHTPGVDSARIVVIGHSLGAALAPRIASMALPLAGLVLLAAPARPLQDSLLGQVRYLDSLKGPLSASERGALATLAAQVARANAPGLSPATPAGQLPFGLPASYWLYQRAYNGPKTAAALPPMPVLLLQGGRDYEVPASNLGIWRAALAGRPAASFVLFPTLDHLFIAGSGPSTPAQYQVPGHVAASVIQRITSFVAGLIRV